MTVLALENLKLIFGDRVQRVRAGQTIDLPEEKARKLIELVPDKARIIQPNFLATWYSPLFGECSGRVLEIVADHVIIGEHSVMKQRVTIPAAWLTGVEPEGVPTQG